MAKIIVLAGGTSEEREVSLRSGAAVSKALGAVRHQVETIDPTQPLSTYLDQFKQAEVIFPALHGLGGEDGSLQLFLEAHGIKYVGSDSQASRLCFFKDLSLEVMLQNNILTPTTELVDFAGFQHSDIVSHGYVLKPNDGGSSIRNLIMRISTTARPRKSARRSMSAQPNSRQSRRWPSKWMQPLAAAICRVRITLFRPTALPMPWRSTPFPA
jgi:D-alanine--D-alanine ligase